MINVNGLAVTVTNGIGFTTTVLKVGPRRPTMGRPPLTVRDLGFASPGVLSAEHPDTHELRGHVFRWAPWAG